MTKQKNDKTLLASLILAAIVIACCGIFWFSRGKPRDICQPIMLDSPGELTLSPISGSGKSGMAIRSADDMTMVYIPAGDFLMGVEEGKPYHGDELPAHIVYLDAYWIDQTEVTNSQYQKCVAVGVCTHPYFNDNVITNFIIKNNTIRIRNEYFYNRALAQHPVVWVRWEQAQTYCHWAGGRFPTEAEWEKAARGTDGRDYPWGDNFFGDRVNYCDINGGCKFPDSDWDDGYQDTAPVGSYPDGASPYGVLDMAGNVSEWVADLYQSDYYVTSPRENPTGPACAEECLARGGNFSKSAANVDTTYRDNINPKWHSDVIGFRCVADAAEQLEPTSQPNAEQDPVFKDMSALLPAGTHINGIWAAPDGSAWVYGDSGIIRLDVQGMAHIMFDKPVAALLGVDESGRVWAVGEGQEFMTAFDGSEWKIYGPEQGWQGHADNPYLSPGMSESLAQDAQGNIWIASGVDMVHLYESDNDTWRSLSSEKLGFPIYKKADYQGYILTDAIISVTGEVWLSACIGEGEVLHPFGIWNSAGDRWLAIQSTNQDCVLDMATGADGTIWAGGFDALLKYDPLSARWSRIDLPPYDHHQVVSRIIINPINGLPWIQVIRYGGASIYGSLAYYHLDSSGWVFDMESPSFLDIGTAFELDGTAWMCGDGQVMKSDEIGWNEVAKLNLSDCMISIDGTGRLWVVGVGQADLWMLKIGLD